MVDFNLIVNESTKTESFWGFSQNWFDVLTVALTILSLWLAYYLGEKGYKRDKKDKKKEQEQLIETEVKLFKINLEQLLIVINKQITALHQYKTNQNFSLEFQEDLQVDFLKFVGVKNIYESIGFNNQEKLDSVNKLFSSLYSLNDFRNSLRDSVRTYIIRYNELEKGFYLYRKLMYTMMHQIANRNAIELIPTDGGLNINFGSNFFARDFFRLSQGILLNPAILDANGVVIRSKIIELFILPAIGLSKQYIPANSDAIEVSDMANEVNSSWINMEVVTKAHFSEIDGHVAVLEKAKENIEKFLE